TSPICENTCQIRRDGRSFVTTTHPPKERTPMFRFRATAMAAVAAVGVSLLATAPAGAAATTTLTVHYYSVTGSDGGLEARALDGSTPTSENADEDDFGTVAEFTFAGE